MCNVYCNANVMCTVYLHLAGEAVAWAGDEDGAGGVLLRHHGPHRVHVQQQVVPLVLLKWIY